MKKSQARPRKEGPAKVTIFKKRAAAISQYRLAHIQQLQSDITELQRQLTKEWNALRKELLRGISVQTGPIRAFISRRGGRNKLVVK